MDEIDRFFNASCFAVAGASEDRSKYGNIVFRSLLDAGLSTLPVNPSRELIEGHRCIPSVELARPQVESLSVVTQPAITLQIVRQAITCQVKNIWMQPGSQCENAAKEARAAGLTVIDDGRCILVELARR